MKALLKKHPSSVICVALIVLPYLLFFRQTLGLSVFYVHDIQYYFFPYRKVATDILFSGHLPLWNPYANAGMPLIGDGQTAIFYPPNWFFLIFQPAHALTLAILSTFSVAGVGMFLYLRELRFDRWIAAVAALSFMFTGFFTAHQVHVSIPATAAWVPWTFWGCERVLRRGRAINVVIASVAVAIQATAGHPQIPVYCAVAVGCYALTLTIFELVRGGRISALKPLVCIIAMYAIGAMLAAIQLVPWFELSRLSPRASKTSYELFSSYSLADADWLLYLFPYGYGGMRASWMNSIPIGTPDFDLVVYTWERMPYVGLLPLALAGVGMFELRGLRKQIASDSSAPMDRLVAIVVVLVLALLLAAGGSTPVGKLLHSLPLIGQLRGQARATAIASFAIAALAAFGLARAARVARSGERTRRFDVAYVVVAVVLFASVCSVVGFANFAHLGSFKEYPQFFLGCAMKLRNANAYVPLLLSLLSAAALIWLAFGATRVKFGVIAMLIAIDLCGFALTFNPTTDPSLFSTVPASVVALRKDTDSYRVAVFLGTDRLSPQVARDQLAISWAMVYGLEDVNGFNSLQPRRLVDFLFSFPFLPQRDDVSYGGLPPHLLADPINRVLTLLSVRYALLQKPFNWPAPEGWVKVFEDDNVTILRNPVDAKRAFFADLVLTRDDADRALQMVHDPQFDPVDYAVVERSLTAEQAQELAAGAGPATVEVRRVSPNELHIETDTTSKRLLVLNETFFPGWEAEVVVGDGGVSLPIHRTNYLFRGLVVPAGKNIIRMVYRPGSVILGAWITVISSVGCIAVCAGSMWRRRSALVVANS